MLAASCVEGVLLHALARLIRVAADPRDRDLDGGGADRAGLRYQGARVRVRGRCAALRAAASMRAPVGASQTGLWPAGALDGPRRSMALRPPVALAHLARQRRVGLGALGVGPVEGDGQSVARAPRRGERCAE